jgi:hypothetical protein
MIDRWEQDLRGMTDEGVRDRLALARDHAESSLRPGTGRNPKAARMWREKAGKAEAELQRRGLDFGAGAIGALARSVPSTRPGLESSEPSLSVCSGYRVLVICREEHRAAWAIQNETVNACRPTVNVHHVGRSERFNGCSPVVIMDEVVQQNGYVTSAVHDNEHDGLGTHRLTTEGRRGAHLSPLDLVSPEGGHKSSLGLVR